MKKIKSGIRMKTESGDWYEVPEKQKHEIQQYRDAVERGDEMTMLKFEEGTTGWKYIPD